MLTIEIREWGQFIDKIAMCSQRFGNVGIWWRGHSDSEWKLSPTVYRDSEGQFEQSRCISFINQGKTRHSNTPLSDDYTSWLFLMRHYGLKSRLLDWTMSPLIALYFAVSESNHTNQPIALWGLNPGVLNSNQTSGGSNIAYLAGAHEVIPIIKEAFEFIPNSQSQKILAISPEEFDVRQMVQMSTFTIHGISTPLEQLDGSDEFLCKLEITPDNLDTFKQGLHMLGIRESILFPDLEHLAKEINSRSFSH